MTKAEIELLETFKSAKTGITILVENPEAIPHAAKEWNKILAEGMKRSMLHNDKQVTV